MTLNRFRLRIVKRILRQFFIFQLVSGLLFFKIYQNIFIKDTTTTTRTTMRTTIRSTTTRILMSQCRTVFSVKKNNILTKK